MKKIKIKCPAKINLDLKVFKKDEITGFHPIKSIMQTISLFDYLTITLSDGNKITLDGNSNEIPYDEKNICYKAIKSFLEKINKNFDVNVYIEKNIPVCAGLAGGSTDAAGVLYGLNLLLDNILANEEIHKIAATLGSDLNFCLTGGKCLCTNRGEKIQKLPFEDFKLAIIKPKNIKISTKDAYFAFDNLIETSNMPNDLEFAMLDKYKKLQYLHSLGLQMSGSGPTYFLKGSNFNKKINENEYLIINNLNAINIGVSEI